MFDNLRQRGMAFGITFGNLSILSNSRLSLEAGEYARDMGQYEPFHEHIFHAYFTEALDIGNMTNLCDVAVRCGLDPVHMMAALKDHRYQRRLDEARKEAMAINLSGVPTFVVNDRHKLVGAQSLSVFSDLFEKIQMKDVS